MTSPRGPQTPVAQCVRATDLPAQPLKQGRAHTLCVGARFSGPRTATLAKPCAYAVCRRAAAAMEGYMEARRRAQMASSLWPVVICNWAMFL